MRLSLIWPKIKQTTTNTLNKFKIAKRIVEEVDSSAYEIAMSMKRAMDKEELLDMANELEHKAKLLREIARTI
jgi:hypothetical protein